jgi:hypothetical protein
VGVLFALAAIAGRAEVFWPVDHLTWTLVSHIPLALVPAFALSGESEQIVVRVRTLWAKISPWMVRLVTIGVLLVGTFLVLDTLWYFATGELSIPA